MRNKTITLCNVLGMIFRRGFLHLIYNKFLCFTKSKWYTFRYVSGSGSIIFRQSFMKLRIVKDPSAKLILNGDLVLDSHLNLNGGVSITLSKNSLLTINNRFNIGQNCGILVCEDAILSIGGADKEDVSGITSDSKIMCYKRITIGKDFLCSWNVFITDCDWHAMYKEGRQINSHDSVEIGEHVWVGSNVIIGKGAKICDHTIIGAYTKVTKTNIPKNVIVVGLKPEIVTTDIEWKRTL